jgi:hypothetical protein
LALNEFSERTLNYQKRCRLADTFPHIFAKKRKYIDHLLADIVAKYSGNEE